MGAIAVIAAIAAFLGTPSAVAQATHGDVEWLGSAPQRDESQDTHGWVAPLGRDAEPFAAGPLSRAEVVSLYRYAYLPGGAVPPGWTGNVGTCTPGTTSDAHRQAVIDRISYFRVLAGLPGVSLSSNALHTVQVQAAALIMSANNALSHSPSASWSCYSSDGYTGAGSSNLALGVHGVEAIDLYMDDPGSGNGAAGHRRWILYPPRAQMATGDVPATAGHYASNALHVFGATTTRPATPNGVAWPPEGFVPYQNLPGSSNRWSFSYPGANFGAATVTMTGPFGAIGTTLESLYTGYGDNTIVFRPGITSFALPGKDARYTVTVSGVTGSGVPASFTYAVTVIDPDRAVAVRSDFGGDGRGDVLWRETGSGALGMWAMNGATPSWMPIGAVSPSWSVRATGDFDGDGRADILWRETATGNVAIWFMNGSVPTPAWMGPTSTAWSIAGVGDFDGDGRSDVLWRETATGNLMIWFMNGAVANPVWVGYASPAWTIQGIGDFDGDGKSDILWRETATGNVGLFRMDGATPTWASIGPASTAWSVAGVGDFDGDGRSDVLWRETGTGYMLIWFMNGAAAIPTWVGYASPQWTIQSVADFDGDGRSDILWRETATGNVGLYRMNGATAAWTLIGSTSTAWSVQP